MSTAHAPTTFEAPSGSPRNATAVTIATSGTTFDYTDVRALPIRRTDAYQIV